MKLSPRGRLAIAIVVLVALGIFVPPLVNVNRFRGRIATSISNALGRPTTVGAVTLRLLPQPGFDLENVTVADDPAFGAEPMLHADQVTATLRLTSLWRGRLEIAKLSLQYPSLNLVRANDGRWNIEALLEHASRIPTAPTTARPEARPRFPYIEADSGRLNFKIGVEKMVYSLTDADFALWLASEDEARTRLKARMVRTDSYLSDTGTFTFEGRFQRAWNLRDTPMSVTASIENAQLGQLTKLLDGLDRGWRGAVDLDVDMKGTPSDLAVVAQGGINDFRRYDITTSDRVRLETRCTAKYSSPADQFSDIDCKMPVSDGVVRVQGALSGILDPRSYDLSLSAQKLPLQDLVSVVRHAKRDIPDDLTATGNLDAQFSFRKADPTAQPMWSGNGTTTDATFRSATLNPQLALKPVQFGMKAPEPERPVGRGRHKTVPSPSVSTGDYRVTLSPVALAAGASTPVTVSGWFSLNGYDLRIAGDSEIQRLLQIAHNTGIRTPELNANGAAKLDLAITGAWAGLNSPKPTGTAQLKNVKVRMKGVAAPLQIASATLALDNDFLSASNISASFADSRLALTGLVRLRRQCEVMELCPVEFDLHSDQVSTDELNRLFNPRVARRPWYAILGGKPEPSILASLQANGKLSIGHLAIKSLTANHFSANVALNAGRLEMANVQADLWGGKHRGQWNADFTANTPVYTGTGSLDGAAMSQLASLMKDSWASGVVGANYTASLRGFTATELIASATGEAKFDWRRGSLRHVSLNGSNAPLSFTRFSGTIALRDGKMTLSPQTKLAAQSGTYEVSGSASLGRQLDVTLRSGAHSYSVGGTLEKPKIALQPERQASLKQ